MILVTGPTGSGKSTTLYTALSELNSEEVNIVTVEDPVEANIPGINQVQVNPKADLTFASALRAILRQDPDIIMIGEIRDYETASIAVQASITGHLVVSTLHTNSSAATVTRLIDMGIEPFLLADSLVGVIAQRLVRRLCTSCRKERPATEQEKELLNVPLDKPLTFMPAGAASAERRAITGTSASTKYGNHAGPEADHGRQGEPGARFQQTAIRTVCTLRMSASEYVIDGITSISEMVKVSFEQ